MPKRKPLPDQDYLISLIDYDPITGICKWKPRSYDMYKHKGFCDKFNNELAGQVIGQLSPFGYLTIQLKGKNYYLHRLIWKMVYGTDPDTIDHYDGIKTNNRIVNLHDVTVEQNMQNQKISTRNKSGVVGVSYHVKYNKWQASIRVNKKLVFLGQFLEIEDAIKARKQAEVTHGYHVNKNR